MTFIEQLTKKKRDFPSDSDGKKSKCNAEDLCLIPGLGRTPEEGSSYPLQHSCLENFMDRGAWQATYSPWSHKESDTTEQLTFSLLAEKIEFTLVYSTPEQIPS